MIDVFHIGYHKTGTTFLQRGLFSDHPEVVLAGTGRVLCGEIFDQSAYMDFLKASRVPGKLMIESYEGISGNQLSTGSAFRMIDRLRSVNPEARIFICTRNPGDYIDSVYRQQIHEGEDFSFSEFLSRYQEDLRQKTDYDALIRAYRRAFGEDRVLVMTYEHFAEDLPGFLRELCAFLDISPHPCEPGHFVNAGLTGRRLAILRRANTAAKAVKKAGVPEKWIRVFRKRFVRNPLQRWEAAARKQSLKLRTPRRLDNPGNPD